MKTMTARFPGVCSVCRCGIVRGESIAWFGRGNAQHLGCAQGEEHDSEDGHCEDAAAGLEPGTLAHDRRMASRGLSVVRFSSGHVMTQNSRGRCEDAPCCGCCS